MSAVATLINLDGYMAAAGYGTDHPWRIEINASLEGSGKEMHGTVLKMPYGDFYVDDMEGESHIAMRAHQLQELLALMTERNDADEMLFMAERHAREMVEAIRLAISDYRGADSCTALARQMAHFLVLIQLESGPSYSLWLAQQLADELLGTIEGMAMDGGVQ